MSALIDRLNKVKSNITSVNPIQKVNIIAVSKTFTLERINPLIKHGHQHFGENKVQEAIEKWTDIKKTNLQIKKGDIYLVDSGGQYKFGTTDVTRTISLENSNNRIKNIFTRVLKGHIAVANFNLKKNTNGAQIDREARKFLKKIGLDYDHGTGHGVGYFLNVHEGPQSISKNQKRSS